MSRRSTTVRIGLSLIALAAIVVLLIDGKSEAAFWVRAFIVVMVVRLAGEWIGRDGVPSGYSRRLRFEGAFIGLVGFTIGALGFLWALTGAIHGDAQRLLWGAVALGSAVGMAMTLRAVLRAAAEAEQS